MPKLTILSRLVLGYTVILFLVIANTSYTIFQIGKLNNLTYSVLSEKNKIADCKKNLIDSLLSEMKYEKKYIILKDKTINKQIQSAKGDFSKYLKEFTVSLYPKGKNKLEKIEKFYNSYQDSINNETEEASSNKHYSQDLNKQALYNKQQDKAFYGIVNELQKLGDDSDKNTLKKISELEKVGADARFTASAISVIIIFAGLIISIILTRSITGPIAVMKEKTRKIAKGNFEGDLNIFYPPEIAELANSLNLMSNKLKELDKIKSDFFLNISHELRTPLTSIKEGISLFKESIGEKLTDRQELLLRIIGESSNRLIGLVNSILDLSKMEAGMMTFNYTFADIIPLINNAVSEMKPLAITKNINFEVEDTQNLPKVKMDQERILQVLLNFIGNAVKFTPANGHVKISVRQTNGNLQVSVKDTGPGIEKEKLKTIFERFQQVSTQGTYYVNGTGLGLAIVKNIITGHGGKVWAESSIGEGSIFTFTLPL